MNLTIACCPHEERNSQQSKLLSRTFLLSQRGCALIGKIVILAHNPYNVIALLVNILCVRGCADSHIRRRFHNLPRPSDALH